MADDSEPRPATSGLGAVLRELRGSRSQAAFGRVLGGIPQTTVSRWEQGTTDFTVDQLQRVADVTGVSMVDLLAQAGYPVVPPAEQMFSASPVTNGSLHQILSGLVDDLLPRLAQLVQASAGRPSAGGVGESTGRDETRSGEVPPGSSAADSGGTGRSPFISVPEAARVLGIHRSTAYDLVRRGRFPLPVTQVGKQLRVRRWDLDALLTGNHPAEHDD